MNKVILKPSHGGLIIRDPVTKKKLSIDGEPKTLDTFWRRRIKDGSVVEVKIFETEE